MTNVPNQHWWRVAAVCLGLAAPSVLLGFTPFYALIALGSLAGLAATHGASLRQTLRMLWHANVLHFVGAVLLVCAASTWLALDLNLAVQKLTQLAYVLIGGLLIFLVLREMPGRQVQLLLSVLSYSTMGVVLLTLLDAYVASINIAYALHGNRADDPYRLAFVGPLLAVLLPFVWAWLLAQWRKGTPWARNAALPISLISFAAVFVTGGRAGWAALCLATLVFLLVAGRYHGVILHRRHWVIGIATFLLAVLGFGVARDLNVVGQSLNWWHELGLNGWWRLDVWRYGVEQWLQHPWFGVGLQNYRLLPAAEGVMMVTHPHNIWVQVLVELGIVGVLAVMALLLYVLRCLWGYAKGNVYGLAGLCGMLAFLVASSLSTAVLQIWWLSVIVLVVLLAWRVGWSTGKFNRRYQSSKIVKWLPLKFMKEDKSSD